MSPSNKKPRRNQLLIGLLVSIFILVSSCSSGKEKESTPIKTSETNQKRDAKTEPQNASPDTAPPLEPFKKYVKNIPLNAKIEVCEISWPEEYEICDTRFCETMGSFTFRLYRLVSNKKTVMVSESGTSYCQGDSEYAWYYLFDQEENAAYSWEGGNEYLPQTCTFYQNGKAIWETISPSYNDLNNKLKSQPKKSIEKILASEFQYQISQHTNALENRLAELRQCDFSDAENRDYLQKSQKELISAYENEIKKKIEFQPGFIYRLPKPGENSWDAEKVLISGTDIRVRDNPNTQSKILGTVSSFQTGIWVKEVGKMEYISPYGKHPWYKISYFDYSKKKEVSGWIFGAFIAPGVLPKD